MICVGIDIAKDKHDCCILDSDGTVRADCFTIPNNMDGFKQLLQTIRNCTKKSGKIKVGLEATGHYSYNILGFLLDNGLPTAMLTWKNEVHAICDMRFTMQPNTFAIGILSLLNTLPRNVPKENTTMLLCPIP